MAGELELDNYFLWIEPFKGSGDFSLQALYILFLIFVTIIIANLMIAMTVNQTGSINFIKFFHELPYSKFGIF